MAKRPSGRARKGRKTAQKRRGVRLSGKRPNRRARGSRKAVRKTARKAARQAARKAARNVAGRRRERGSTKVRTVPKAARLDRERRILIDDDIVPTPPSSLGLDQRGTAAGTGRAELANNLRKHGPMTPGITAGDVDADFENAYFSGDEAPGGDNPTPDQDRVDDIGKALGVQYDDNEELKGADKISQRDKHRWELDPASSDDYRDRD